MPEAGSQPSQSEKITISTMPSQKTGMLAPKSEADRAQPVEQRVRRARRRATPSAMPPTVESSSAVRGEEQGGLEAARAPRPAPAASSRASGRGRRGATWPIQCDVLHVAAARSSPSCGAQAGEVLLGGLRAQHDLGRVARREMQDEEDDDRHAEQHRHQQQEPAGEVAPTGEPGARYFSEIVSTRRSKLGWSLKPCTRLAMAAIWISWSTKIHGASSTRMRWASR